MQCDPLLFLLYRFLPTGVYSGLAQRVNDARIVVDVGGGAGGLGKELRRRHPWTEYVVVDPDACLLGLIDKNPLSHAIQGVAEHLPLRGLRGSLVVMHDALHHTSDPVQSLREAARVGHCILVSDIDPGTMVGRIVVLFEKMLLYPANFLSPSSLIEIVERLGLVVVALSEGRRGYLVKACRERPRS